MVLRKLIIMRHGKSDWGNSSMDDFDRPLNARGVHDAKKMGEFLIDKNLLPELLISSPAFRALSTAKLVSENFANGNKKFQKIETCKDFYYMGFKDYVDRIREVDDSIETLMVVGHNPKLDDLADFLLDEKTIIEKSIIMKTSTVVVGSFEASWSTLDRQSLKLEKYITPRMLDTK